MGGGFQGMEGMGGFQGGVHDDGARSQHLYGGLNGKSKVVRLSASKFPDAKAKFVWFIEFYSVNCPHCQNAVPAVEAVAGKLEGIVKVGGVSCDADNSLCAKHGVQSLPSFKLILEGKAIDYEGSVETKSMLDFVTENYPAPIANIRRTAAASDFFKAVVAGKKAGAMVLFTDEYETPLLYKGLAYQLRDKLAFGEVRASNLQVSDHFGVGKYPTLLFFCGGEEASAVVEYGNGRGGIGKDVKTLKEWATGLADRKACLEAARKGKRSAPRKSMCKDSNRLFGG